MIFGLRAAGHPLLLVGALLGGLPFATGCSYIFVTPPRSEYGGAVAADCTTNVAAPVIDTLLTTTNLLSTVIVGGEDNVKNKGEAVGVGLLATGFWLSSAIYGFYNTSSCTALRTEEGQGPYHRPVRIRRTVLSGPGGTQAMPPDPLLPPSQPQANSVPPQPYPVPSSQPNPGVGGAGGTLVPAAPPPVPPVRQKLDQDDPG